MKDLSQWGSWWLPEEPAFRVQGMLTHTGNGGIWLEIPLGHLGGSASDIMDAQQKPQDHRVVRGLLADGQYATLRDVGISSRTSRQFGFGRERWFANTAFIGKEDAGDCPIVCEVAVSYPHLLDWMGIRVGELNRISQPGMHRLSFDYRHAVPEGEVLAQTEKWSIAHEPGLAYAFSQPCSFEVTTTSTLKVHLATPQPFSAVYDHVLAPLKQFIEFCLDRPVRTDSAVARREASESWFEIRWLEAEQDQEASWLPSSEMLLPKPRIADRLGQIIPAWMEADGDERRAIGLMVGLLSRDGYSDLRFLAAAQALEAFARVGTDQFELPKPEFRARLDRIVAACDAQLQPWVREKLANANYRSATSLERDLLDYVGPYVDVIASDTDKLLRDIRNNRNFYTHRGGRSRRDVYEGRELLVLTEAVHLLLKAVALRRLGLPQERTRETLIACDRTRKKAELVAAMYGSSASSNSPLG